MESPLKPGDRTDSFTGKIRPLQMMNEPVKLKVKDKMKIGIQLPRQGVSLLKLSW